MAHISIAQLIKATADRLSKFRTGSRSAAVARSALNVFVINAIGVFLNVALQVWLARALGVNEFGTYIYVLAWLNILLVFSLMGGDTASLRYVAAYTANGQLGLFWRFFRRFRIRTATYSGSLAMSMVVIGLLFRSEIGQEKLYVLVLGSVLLPINALIAFNGAVLQALNRVAESQLLQTIFRVIMFAVLLALATRFLMRELTAVDAIIFNIISALTVLFVLWIFTKRTLPRRVAAELEPQILNEWRSVSISLFAISGAQFLISQADVLLIGIFMTTTDAGIYASASRIAGFVTFGITAVNSVLAPAIADCFARGERQQLQATVTSASRFVLVYTVPIVVFFIFGGRWLLGWFGSEFVSGYAVLLVLIFGQAAIAFFGSVGFLLTMTGHQSDAFKVIVTCGLIVLVLQLIFIPIFGLIGAAVATAATTILRSLVLSLIARRRLGIRSTAF